MRIATFILLALSTRIVAADRSIKVWVYASGTSRFLSQVAFHCNGEISKLRGVEVTDPPREASDYAIIFAVADRDGQVVAISSYALQRIDPGLRDAFFIKTESRGEEDLIAAGSLLNIMSPPSQMEVRIGAPRDIPAMCRDLARTLDAGPLQKERQFPRSVGQTEQMLENMLLRMGAKELH